MAMLFFKKYEIYTLTITTTKKSFIHEIIDLNYLYVSICN